MIHTTYYIGPCYYYLEVNQRSRSKKKRGRVRSAEFRLDVWSRVILAAVDAVENVGYSYEVVRLAAEETKTLDKRKDDLKAQSLELSDRWIDQFFKESGFARRKIARDNIKMPSDEQIYEAMKKSWTKHQSFNIKPENNWNLDETAFTYAAAPLYIFVPKAHDRAEGKFGDTKARFYLRAHSFNFSSSLCLIQCAQTIRS